MPIRTISALIGPSSPASSFSIPTMMTAEMKLGKYDSVCMDRLKPGDVSSFSSSASRIGAGKPIAKLRNPNRTVFLMIRNANGLAKNDSNHRSPTQGLPKTPRTKWKF